MLHQTDPRFEALLAEPGRFKARDCGLLFGRTFLRGMVRDASDDQKLKSLGQPGSRPPASSSSRHGRPSSSSRGAKSGRSGSGFTLHGNFNKRGSRPGSSSNRGSRLVASVPLDSSVSLPPTLVGGRVRNFSSFWPSLTADRWVLDAVSLGVKIPFIELPSQIRPGKNMHFSAEMKGICEAEVSSLMAKGAIERVPLGDLKFVSGIFVIPKSSGGFRPIINLKGLNRFVEHLHFKMEGVSVVRGMVREGDFFTKIDLPNRLPHHSHSPRA